MIEIFTISIGLISFLNILFKFNIKLKLLIFWIFLLFLIFFDGLRWETGSDWSSYFNSFNRILEFRTPGFELGFYYYQFIIRKLTDNYTIFLLITSAFIYIGIFYTIFKITNYSFISIFLLTAQIPWYSGSMRQIIAISIFLLSFKYLFSRKLIKYSFIIAIASLFHSTVIPFYLIYFLYNASGILFILYGIIFLIIAIFVKYLIPQIDNIINLVSEGRSFESSVSGNYEQSNPFLGISRKVLTIVLSFSFYKKYFIQNIKITFFFYLSLFSIIFYIIGTYFINNVSSRLDIYTSTIFLSIFIGLLENKFKYRFKILLFLLLFTFILNTIFYIRLEFLDLFHPYKSIFYNVDFKRDLY